MSRAATTLLVEMDTVVMGLVTVKNLIMCFRLSLAKDVSALETTTARSVDSIATRPTTSLGSTTGPSTAPVYVKGTRRE